MVKKQGLRVPEYRQVGFPLPCLPKIKNCLFLLATPFSKQRMASMKGGGHKGGVS